MKSRELTPDALRRLRLKAVHAEARRLGLDEDVYRALIERVSGEHGPAVRSSGDCSPEQLAAVLDELRGRGGRSSGKSVPGGDWPGRPAGVLPPLLAKIEALLADAGRPWSYAISTARRICKVDRLEWCDDAQLSKVVAALQIDADRHGRGRGRRGGRR